MNSLPSSLVPMIEERIRFVVQQFSPVMLERGSGTNARGFQGFQIAHPLVPGSSGCDTGLLKHFLVVEIADRLTAVGNIVKPAVFPVAVRTPRRPRQAPSHTPGQLPHRGSCPRRCHSAPPALKRRCFLQNIGQGVGGSAYQHLVVILLIAGHFLNVNGNLLLIHTIVQLLELCHIAGFCRSCVMSTNAERSDVQFYRFRQFFACRSCELFSAELLSPLLAVSPCRCRQSC